MSRLKMFFPILCCIVTFLIGSCKKHWDDVPPGATTSFKIIKNNVPLNDSVLSKTIMYYINDAGQMITNPNSSALGSPTNKTFDTLFMYVTYDYFDHPAEFYNSGIAFYNFPNLLSANAGIRNFYLKYPDGDIDTLYIYAETVSQKQGAKEACFCTVPLRVLKFNGKDVPIDTTVHLSNGEPVYLFEK